MDCCSTNFVASYSSFKGVEVRARVAEVLYFIVVVPVFLLLLLGLRDVDLANLTPLFTTYIGNTVVCSYAVFILFSMIEMILFIKPFLKPEQSKSKQIRKLNSYVIQAITVCFVFILLFFIETVGIIGENAANSTLWSSVSIMQIIEIPGTLINRQDSLILGLWLISTFTLISGFIFYINLITKHMFRIQHSNSVMPIVVILLILICLLPINLEDYYVLFNRYMMYIGIPQSIIMPIIVIMVGNIRKRKKMVHVNSIVTLLIVVGCCACLTGCQENVDIEDRDFVQVIGVDKGSANLNVYIVQPDLDALTDQGPTEDPTSLIQSFTGTDYLQIEEQYKLRGDKRLDYSHLKAIVIGSEFAKDTDHVIQFLDYVENNYDIAKKTLVFISDTTAKDVIDMNGNVKGGLGDYLERFYKNSLANSEKDEISLFDLINAKNNESQCVLVPRLTTVNDQLAIDGVGIMYHSKLMKILSSEQTIYADIAGYYGENSRIFLSNNASDTIQYVIRLNDIKQQTELSIQSGQPVLNMNIEALGTVEKGFEPYQSLSIKDKKILYGDLERYVSEQVKTNLLNQMNELMKEESIDYLNLYRKSFYLNRHLYEEYKNDQSAFIHNLSLHVQVNITIND